MKEASKGTEKRSKATAAAPKTSVRGEKRSKATAAAPKTSVRDKTRSRATAAAPKTSVRGEKRSKATATNPKANSRDKTRSRATATNPKKIAQDLLSWYALHRRRLPWREDPSPYHVWLSEIMLQQTRVEAVKGYYERFLAAFPTVADLAAAEEDDYLKLWQGLGYYSRVRNLHKTAVLLTEESKGVLPRDRKSLQALPGIGPYTAAAIASIAYGEKAPAIDGNLLRVFSRLTCYEENILSPAAQREAEAFFLSCMEALPSPDGGKPAVAASNKDPKAAGPHSAASKGGTPAHSVVASSKDATPAGPGAGTLPNQEAKPAGPGAASNKDATPVGPGAFNQALMDLGALVCLPNSAPRCEDCPLAGHCRAHAEGRESALPLREKKQTRKVEKMTLLLIHFNGGVLLRKRPGKGLLAGLYEYPHAEGFLTEKTAIRFVEELGFGPLRIAKLPPSKHLFTHREWQMRAYEVWADQWTDFSRRAPAHLAPAETATEDGQLFIADRAAIRETWSIPSAFAPYTRYLLGE